MGAASWRFALTWRSCGRGRVPRARVRAAAGGGASGQPDAPAVGAVEPRAGQLRPRRLPHLQP
eukprot:1056569-Pyramimonas_sp.AAC.2